MYESNALRRLIALGSVLVLVVGCGIAGQSPTPVGSATPAATTAAGTATPSTGTPAPRARRRLGHAGRYVDFAN